MATEITTKELKLNTLNEIDDIQEENEKDFKYSPTKDSKFILYIRNNDSNNVDVTIKAGDYFQNEILGDDNEIKEEGIAQDDVYVSGVLESARFKNEDGEIEIFVDTAGTTGTDEDVDICVFELSYEE